GYRVDDAAFLVLDSRLDETIALHALQRGVDLADVEVDAIPGGVLQFALQLVAVHRLGRQEGEQTFLDSHRYGVCIPGMPVARGRRSRKEESPVRGSGRRARRTAHRR